MELLPEGVDERLRGWSDRLWFWVRTHRLSYFLLIVAVLVAGVLAAAGQLTKTTAVTTESALAEFEARRDTLTAPVPPSPDEQPAQQVQTNVSGSKASAPKGAAAPSISPACEWVCSSEFSPPESGVYEYFQCGKTSGQCTGLETEPQGYEKFSGGLTRYFPRTGKRLLTKTSAQTWNNRHKYADEHAEEFDLSITPSGVFNHRYKVEIQVGPVPGGSEIRMEPPLRFVSWPLTLGKKWSGSWVDSNQNSDADYDCSATGKDELQIAARNYRTWQITCTLHLKGPKQKGEVILRAWVSPEVRNTLQELYDQNLSTPQGDYIGKWMVTLANDKPAKPKD